ncbi:hypothetical protein Thimo_0385 [Thioflavicoccus mobilis 8321]|uniref:L,D-TPase catalytic domain-containing protein n=1 Tax=Thioflavicoccus mobilis 8321 TaxID=765912 RepID=L0GVC0_9GAMM|nr:L,D-transpeptidase family protein [Thioflavicoccus mobilis]AGA89249.1 hypothetical protein Thimo_0385 [Thioflavicoccus mobilis 8321]
MSARLVFILLCCGLVASPSAGAMSLLFKRGETSTAAEPSAERAAEIAAEYRRLVADLVVVEKSERRLYLVKDERPLRSYPISLGFAPKGPKEREGDGRTPEGRYVLDWRRTQSQFYKAIHISYPSARDRSHAASMGVDPGGLIMIHGQPRPNEHAELQALVRNEDWTQGCIAVSNQAIDEIWEATRNGTPIEIRP